LNFDKCDSCHLTNGGLGFDKSTHISGRACLKLFK